MFSQSKYSADDLSEVTEGAKKLIKKAEKHSPRMTKEIKMTSCNWGGGMRGCPCAKTNFDMHIDCSMVKLAAIIMACILIITVFCAIKKKIECICFKKNAG